jgi:hypothetical protein
VEGGATRRAAIRRMVNAHQSKRPSKTCGSAGSSPGGRPGRTQGRRDDQGRDDFPACSPPRVWTVARYKISRSFVEAHQSFAVGRITILPTSTSRGCTMA